MRTNLFFARKAVLAACVLCFAGVKAEKIADPGGLEWVVMDAETEGAIPFVPGAEGDFLTQMGPWGSQVVSIVDNPKKDFLYNQSEKSVCWVKENVEGEGSWGSVALQMLDLENNYWDLHAWEQISADVYVEGFPLNQYKIGLNNSGIEIASVETWGVNGAADEWNRITVSLDEFKKSGKLTPESKTNKIIFYINGGDENKMNVYVDNIKFTRSTEPSGGTGMKEVNAGSLLIYPNPATESISLTGVQGHVSIYTLSGMEVYAAEAYAGEQIAVGNLASGIYLVKAGGVCAKFVKE